ncbi:MAG: hypothetical protein RLY31_233 [Bacteroidota bacterium]
MLEPNPFPLPVRQSPVAVWLLMGHAMKLLLRQLWAVLLLLFLRPAGSRDSFWDGMVLVFLLLSTANAFVRYFFKRFHIRDRELILETGWLRKRRTLVPMERIQTVSLRQSVFHRLFGVMAVDIDTAGSVGQEFRLEALPPAQAYALQRYVGRYRTDTDAGSTEEGSYAANHPGDHKDLVCRLSHADLVKVGLSQNHFRTAGILLAFLAGFANDLIEALGRQTVGHWQRRLPASISQGDLSLLLTIGLVLLAFSMLVTLLRTFLVYHGLTVRLSRRHIAVEAGWFAKATTLVEVDKIQWVDIRSTPLLRYFGLASVRLPQAASPRNLRGRGTASVPGCAPAGQQRLLEAYWPEWDPAAATAHGVGRRIILRQFIRWGLLPLLAIGLPAYGNIPAAYLPFVVGWLSWSVWLAIRYHRTWVWETCPDGLRVSWGVLNRRTVILKDHKLQVVRLHGSRWLHRAGFSHLTLVTAAGSLTLPYLPCTTALALADHLLFKVASGRQSPM